MTERERLIELLKGTGMGETESHFVADYLLKHGVIAPPCKVGDTVYYMYKGGGRVYEGAVTNFIYASETKSFVIHCDGCCGKYGQYVFLAREEAEAALAERGDKS